MLAEFRADSAEPDDGTIPGLRFGAVKHPDSDSTSSLITQLRARFSDAGIVVVGEALSKLAVFLAIPIAAIVLSDTELGILAIGLLFYTLLLILFDFGLSGAATKLQFNDPVDGSVWWLLFTVIGVGLPLTYLIGPVVVGAAFTSIEFYPMLASIPIAAAAGAAITVGQATLRARFEFKAFTGLTVLRSVGTVVPAVTAAATTSSAAGYFVGMTAGLVVVAFVTLIALRGAIGPPSTTQWRGALAFGIPLIPHLLFGVIMNLADRLLLERWTSLEDLGRYALAYQLAWATGALALALNNVWIPMLYRRSSDHGIEAGDAMVARAAWPAMLSIDVLAVTVVIASPFVYGLLRPDSHTDMVIFVAVGAASAIYAMYLLAVGPVFVRERTWVIPIVTGIGAAVNLTGNVLLIPSHGINGAAVATFLGYAASLLSLTLVERAMKFPTWYVKRMVSAGTLQVLTGSVAVALAGWLSLIPVTFGVVIAAVGVRRDPTSGTSANDPSNT